MVIRLGRYGEFLACSNYPEHKETRELPTAGGDGTAAASADGPNGTEPAQPVPVEACPKCGETDGGVLVQRRGRFGPFMGCSRYPDCDYIKRDGPPPPPPLAFEAICPLCRQGHLVTRRARRTGSLFWGCSRYPTCRFTTSHEPVGAVHDVDDGPIGRSGDAGICLICGAPVEIEGIPDLVGKRLAGGDPNPAALAKPAGGRSRSGATSRGAGTRTTTRTRRATPAAAGGRKRTATSRSEG
jgi:ssDNA-binding Zn-finger/Zn-ribbon topoisomerase 1